MRYQRCVPTLCGGTGTKPDRKLEKKCFTDKGLNDSLLLLISKKNYLRSSKQQIKLPVGTAFVHLNRPLYTYFHVNQSFVS